jgi:MYXO-CTERM domain-containing protein
MKRRLSVLAIAAFVALLRSDARACDEVPSPPHTIDSSMQAIDHTPPTLPAIPALDVYYAPTSPQGCDCGNCGENSYFGFSAVARDDMTPRTRIGYRMSLESGTLPRGVELPATAIEPNGDIVQVQFNSETVAALGNFTLRVIAIDLAGNESAPQIVVMRPASGSECSVSSARASRSGLGWLAFLALIVAAYRRRRR